MREPLSPRAKVLVASMIGMTVSFSAVGPATFSLFVLPLSHAFGWGRGDISVALTLKSLAAAGLAPFAGLLADRFGPRRILLPAIALFAGLTTGLGLLDGRILGFYALYLLISVAGLGASSLIYSRVVVGWFESRRGLALGAVLCGIGAGVAVLPLFVRAMIAAEGWRTAYAALGAVIAAISLPLAAAWIRDPPAPRDPAPAFRTRIARRPFLLLALTFVLLGACSEGMLGHLAPLLSDRGMPAGRAAAVASSLGLALIGGRLLTGYLMDRFFAPVVAAAFLSLQVAGLGLLFAHPGPSLLLAATLMFGLSLGAEMDILGYLVSRYFPMPEFGRVYGLLFGAMSLGLAIGPVAMGYGHQLTGSYDAPLGLLLAAAALAIPPLLFLGPYADAAPPSVSAALAGAPRPAHDARP